MSSKYYSIDPLTNGKINIDVDKKIRVEPLTVTHFVKSEVALLRFLIDIPKLNESVVEINIKNKSLIYIISPRIKHAHEKLHQIYNHFLDHATPQPKPVPSLNFLPKKEHAFKSIVCERPPCTYTTKQFKRQSPIKSTSNLPEEFKEGFEEKRLNKEIRKTSCLVFFKFSKSNKKPSVINKDNENGIVNKI